MYYRDDPEQLSMKEAFFLPFGGRLRKDNRRVRLAEIMPWRHIEEIYAQNMSEETGRPGISSRIAFGSLYIKAHCRLTDEETVRALQAPLYAVLCGAGGEANDYLFCDEFGEQLTENALRLAVARYNKSRGVEKTSIHLFRHTFARKYLVDCGGNAFTLQKILGHSTLKMTKHYCTIFDADRAKNYDSFSPLAQIKANNTRIKKSR